MLQQHNDPPQRPATPPSTTAASPCSQGGWVVPWDGMTTRQGRKSHATDDSPPAPSLASNCSWGGGWNDGNNRGRRMGREWVRRRRRQDTGRGTGMGHNDGLRAAHPRPLQHPEPPPRAAAHGVHMGCSEMGNNTTARE
jgi:hypothetical protein